MRYNLLPTSRTLGPPAQVRHLQPLPGSLIGRVPSTLTIELPGHLSVLQTSPVLLTASFALSTRNLAALPLATAETVGIKILRLTLRIQSSRRLMVTNPVTAFGTRFAGTTSMATGLLALLIYLSLFLGARPARTVISR